MQSLFTRIPDQNDSLFREQKGHINRINHNSQRFNNLASVETDFSQLIIKPELSSRETATERLERSPSLMLLKNQKSSKEITKRIPILLSEATTTFINLVKTWGQEQDRRLYMETQKSSHSKKNKEIYITNRSNPMKKWILNVDFNRSPSPLVTTVLSSNSPLWNLRNGCICSRGANLR